MREPRGGSHIHWLGQRIGFAALIAAIGCPLAAGPASVAMAQTPPANPQFGFRDASIEGVLLQRGSLNAVSLTRPDDAAGSIPGAATSFAPVLGSGLEPGSDTGVRLSVGAWVFGRPVRWSFLGVWGLEDSFTRTGLTSPVDPTFSTDAAYELPGADVALANSDSIEAVRVEHNGRLVTGDSAIYPLSVTGDEALQFLFGGRVITMSDTLTTVVFDDPDDFLGLDNDIDRTDVQVDNRMVGIQIGIEGTRPVTDAISVGGFVKGGLLANFISADTSFTSDNSPANSLERGVNDVGFAQFIETSGTITAQVSDRVSLTASGMVLWVNGISDPVDSYALASDAHATTVDHNSSAVFYGARLGVKIDLN